MKKWKFIGLLLLSIAMVSGCSEPQTQKVGNSEGQSANGKETVASQEENGQTVENQSKLKKNTVLMAIGEETVTLTEAKTYAYFLKRQYDSNIGNAIWKYDMGDGTTFESYAMEQIQNMLTQIKIIKQEAGKADIELTDDEAQEAEEYAAQYMKGITKAEKKKYGVTVKSVAEVFKENMLAQKFFEVSTNDVNTDIKDEEVKQITVQYLMIMTKGKDKNGIKVSMNNDEKKEAKKKAKKLLKEAKKTEDFRTLAESNSDVEDVELTFSKSEGPAEFGEQAFSLKSGELSDIIEGEKGYYIVYCVSDDDEDATQQKKEELIAGRQKEEFQKKYEDWSVNYAVVISKSLWKEIEL